MQKDNFLIIDAYGLNWIKFQIIQTTTEPEILINFKEIETEGPDNPKGIKDLLSILIQQEPQIIETENKNTTKTDYYYYIEKYTIIEKYTTNKEPEQITPTNKPIKKGIH